MGPNPPPDLTSATMPTYQYACDACGASAEIRQRFSDEPLSDCPDCGSVSLRRVIFPAGVIFKGSGWYKTDSRPRSKTSDAMEAKKESSAEKDSDSPAKDDASSAGSESKPETTPAGAAAGG